MPADGDWALVAPYMDRALLRNPFVYGLGRDMGLQAPNLRHAEVYVNTADGLLQESDYAGVYFVTETIKNSKQRTDLSQLEPEDTELPAIRGSFMKFDWMVSEPPTIPCTGSALSNDGGDCFTDLARAGSTSNPLTSTAAWARVTGTWCCRETAFMQLDGVLA